MTPSEIKQRIDATLRALNAHGRVASIYDVKLALDRAIERKVAEQLGSVFGQMSVDDLATARSVVGADVDAELKASATLTQPPASPRPPKKRKG